MSRIMSYGNARFSAGQKDVICMPRKVLRKYIIVVTHGYTGDSSQMLTFTIPGLWSLINKLCAAGAVCVASDFHGDNWGNDASVTDIENIRLAAATYGCSTSKVVLFGGSMGGATIYSYMRDHGDRVSGASLVAPTTALNDYYANPDSTLGNPDIAIATQKTSIATAWGTTSPNPLPSKADPLANAATIAAWGIPHTVYYSDSSTNHLGDADDDGNPVIKVADLQQMKSLVGAQQRLVYLGNSQMHGDPETVSALDRGLTNELIGWAT